MSQVNSANLSMFHSSLYRPPHFLIRLVGKWHARRGCVQISGDVCKSSWIDRQLDSYNRFEIQELEQCKAALSDVRRRSGRWCSDFRRSIPPATEADRMRDLEDRQKLLPQLNDVTQIIRDREHTCVSRCMMKEKICREMIADYLEGCVEKTPDVSMLRCERLDTPLFSEENPPWKRYHDYRQPSDLEREEVIRILKGGH